MQSSLYNATANPTAATLNATRACCARGVNPPLVLFDGFDVEVDLTVELADVGTVTYWREDDFEPEAAGTTAAADEDAEVAGAEDTPLPATELPAPPARLAPFGELYGGAVA